MKKTITLLLFCVQFTAAGAQSLLPRTNSYNTSVDSNLFVTTSFRAPVFEDTAAANAVYSLDSCGKLIYTRNTGYWYRQCEPARWVQFADKANGLVTEFKATGLEPLFTTSVANSATTPSLSFELADAPSYTVFGRAAGAGAPSYVKSLDSNWIPDLHSAAYYNRQFVRMTGDDSIKGIKTFNGKRIQLFASSDAAVQDGVFFRVADTRADGNVRSAGIRFETNNTIGLLSATSSVAGAPFSGVDGLYLRSPTAGRSIVMTTTGTTGPEKRALTLEPNTNATFSGSINVAGDASITGFLTSRGSGPNSNKFGAHTSAINRESLVLGDFARDTLNTVEPSFCCGGWPTIVGARARGNGTAVGWRSEAQNYEAVAIGPQAKATGLATVAIGDGARAIPAGAGGNQIVMGDVSWATGNINFFMGGGAGIGKDYVICIGCQGSNSSYNLDVSTDTHQGFLGWYQHNSPAFMGGVGFANDWWLGGPVQAALPHPISLNITDAMGPNAFGTVFRINGSKGTGNAKPGPIYFTTGEPGASGSALQTQVTRMAITRNVGINTTEPSSSLQVAGSFAPALRSVTADTELTDTDYTLLADASSGSISINLPSAAGITGRLYIIKKTDNSANTVILAGTTDGVTDRAISTPYGCYTIQSNGNKWMIVGAFGIGTSQADCLITQANAGTN
ncbi:MAG: hypothetical protein ABW019_07045 [Chitinophagaceae bacterium]